MVRTIRLAGATYDVYNYTDTEPILPDTSTWDDYWYSEANDVWSNGNDSVYRWMLGDSYLYVYTSCGVVQSVSINKQDIESYLRDCEIDVDRDEWLAEWGIEPTLNVAPDNYGGACRIWHKHHYYHGTCGAPSDGWARDASGEICEFDCWDDAQAYVNTYYSEPSCYEGVSECNVLSHGQASADTLIICKV